MKLVLLVDKIVFILLILFVLKASYTINNRVKFISFYFLSAYDFSSVAVTKPLNAILSLIVLLFLRRNIYLFIYLSIYLFICLFVYLFIYLFMYSFIIIYS